MLGGAVDLYVSYGSRPCSSSAAGQSHSHPKAKKMEPCLPIVTSTSTLGLPASANFWWSVETAWGGGGGGGEIEVL